MSPAPKAAAANEIELSGYALRLRGIHLAVNIGATKRERQSLQDLIVDVDLELPQSVFPPRDRVRDVLSYDDISTWVVEEATAAPLHLLESYVARVIRRLLAETPATLVRVSATKRHVPTRHPVDAAYVELVGRRVP